MPSSTFFSELTEGLTLFCSISEMVLLVTPTRLASSRWDRPFEVRTACSRDPMSMSGWGVPEGVSSVVEYLTPPPAVVNLPPIPHRFVNFIQHANNGDGSGFLRIT